MTQAGIFLRQATPEDAPTLARLIDMASEGDIARAFAARAAEGEGWLEAAAREIAGEASELSHRHAVLAEVDGAVAGMIVLNWFGDGVDLASPEGQPARTRAMLALAARLPGTLLIRELAVLPEFRRRGVATALLLLARNYAQSKGIAALTLVVRADNRDAVALYGRNGFMAVEESLVEGGGPEERWLLMMHPVEATSSEGQDGEA